RRCSSTGRLDIPLRRLKNWQTGHRWLPAIPIKYVPASKTHDRDGQECPSYLSFGFAMEESFNLAAPPDFTGFDEQSTVRLYQRRLSTERSFLPGMAEKNS
ncbi:MAG: hypothetical protein AB8B55_20285, partial [Mariniblastus sp.]